MRRAAPFPFDAAAAPRDYLAFGLRLRSALPLPELRAAGGAQGPADAEIACGALDGPGWDRIVSLDKDWFRLALAGVGRFEVRDGRRITLDADASAPPAQIRAFLLGSVMGALLQQRGLLTLHASAVAIDGGAIALLGESGAGKSTLAMQLNARGHALLCDDICVVDFDEDGAAQVWPGIGRLKLWSEAIQASGGTLEGLEPVLQKEDKFHVPAGRIADYRPHRLRAVYLLGMEEAGEEAMIGRLRGAQAVNALMSHTYRGRMVPFLAASERHFSNCLKLLESCGVHEFPRRRGLDRVAIDAEAVERHSAGDGAPLQQPGNSAEGTDF